MKRRKLCFKIILVVLALCLIASCAIFSVRAIQMSIWKNNPVSLPQNFTVTAHTGCGNTEDNSLESIQYGIDKGVDIVEFDLRFDGKIPVLAHDEKHIKDAVTFDAAMELVSTSNTLRVNIDIKDDSHLEEINSIIEKYLLFDRVFFTGVGFERVHLVKEKCPLIPFMINHSLTRKQSRDKSYLNLLADTIKESGAFGININYKELTKEVVETFQDNNLLVSVWTVNSNYDLLKVLSLAPDNITTRRPDRLLSIIANY